MGCTRQLIKSAEVAEADAQMNQEIARRLTAGADLRLVDDSLLSHAGEHHSDWWSCVDLDPERCLRGPDGNRYLSEYFMSWCSRLFNKFISAYSVLDPDSDLAVQLYEAIIDDLSGKVGDH